MSDYTCAKPGYCTQPAIGDCVQCGLPVCFTHAVNVSPNGGPDIEEDLITHEGCAEDYFHDQRCSDPEGDER